MKKIVLLLLLASIVAFAFGCREKPGGGNKMQPYGSDGRYTKSSI